MLFRSLDPLAMDEAMEKDMLNCSLNVCDNDSMSMFEGYPNNELLELLKTRDNYTLPTCGLPLICCAYSWFKF